MSDNEKKDKKKGGKGKVCCNSCHYNSCSWTCSILCYGSY